MKTKFGTGLLALTLGVATLAPVQSSAGKPACPTIVDIALAVNADNGQFSTLIAALQTADLVTALDGKKQYTVFAPTDEAFLELGLTADNVGTLDPAFLTNVLLYHVAHGERFAEDVVDSSKIRMLNGDFAPIELEGEDAFIAGAPILAVDIDACNGVVHVIGAVMLPPTE